MNKVERVKSSLQRQFDALRRLQVRACRAGVLNVAEQVRKANIHIEEALMILSEAEK